jgi:hypothetical protein
VATLIILVLKKRTTHQGETQMTEANAKAKIIADMVAELKAAGWSEKEIAREVDYVDHALRADIATRDDAAWNYGFI